MGSEEKAEGEREEGGDRERGRESGERGGRKRAYGEREREG